MNIKNYKMIRDLSLLLLMIYFFTWYTPFLYEVYSRTYFLVLITSLCTILLFNEKKIAIIKYTDYLWMSFLMILTLGVLRNFIGYTVETITIYVLISTVLISYRTTYYEFNWKLVINTTKFFLLVHIIFVYFQVFFPKIFLQTIVPFFEVHHQSSIPKLMNASLFSGITNQTAYNSGFIVFGIGLILFSLRDDNKKYLELILVFFSAIALMLTGKRAHLLFSVISLCVTYLILSKSKSELKLRIKKSLVLSSIVLIVGASILLIGNEINFLPAEVFYKKIELTIHSIFSGDLDSLTSGRTKLWAATISMFKDNPIFGSGWMFFRDNSKGVLFNSLSHPHNIYLQLLSELGIVGFLAFVFFMVFSLISTIKLLRKHQKEINQSTHEVSFISFSIYIQLFFILYGLTGNVLSDYIYIIMYLVAIGFVNIIQVRMQTTNVRIVYFR